MDGQTDVLTDCTASSLRRRKGSCPTPGRWLENAPCAAPRCPSSRKASTDCRQGATKLRKSKTKNVKKRLSRSNKPLPGVLLVRAELARLCLAASRRRRRLLLPPRLALVLLAPPLSLPDRRRNDADGGVVRGQRLGVLGHRGRTRGVPAGGQGVFAGDGRGHEVSWDRLLRGKSKKNKMRKCDTKFATTLNSLNIAP